MTAPGASGDAEHAYAVRLLQETREELTRADSKAATLFAAVGVVVAVVVGAAAGSGVDISGLATGWQLGITAVAATQTIGLVSLGAALYPATTKALKGPVHFYGDVAQFVDGHGRTDLAALRDNLEMVAADPAARDVEQFAVLAGVVIGKYRHIKRGLVASGIATGLLGAALLVQLVW